MYVTYYIDISSLMGTGGATPSIYNIFENSKTYSKSQFNADVKFQFIILVAYIHFEILAFECSLACQKKKLEIWKNLILYL